MPSYPSPDASNPPLVHAGALLRSLIFPAIWWVGYVILVTLAGQPGVVCVTPLVWLLALRTGRDYVVMSQGCPGRWPLLGPALAGALLGLGTGILFAVVSSRAMPVGNDPGEIAKAQTLYMVMIVGGMLICPGLSVLTAFLTLRRMARA